MSESPPESGREQAAAPGRQAEPIGAEVSRAVPAG